MVQIKSSLLCLLTAASLAAASPFSKRTVAQITTDIAGISAKVADLNQRITAFPLTNGTLVDAVDIYFSSQALIGTLTSTTSDIHANGPVSVADGTTILKSVEAFTPTIQHALTQVVVKKPAFAAQPIIDFTTLIFADLEFLRDNTTALNNALISISPSQLVAEATTLRNTILTAFTTAVAAYP